MKTFSAGDRVWHARRDELGTFQKYDIDSECALVEFDEDGEVAIVSVHFLISVVKEI